MPSLSTRLTWVGPAGPDVTDDQRKADALLERLGERATAYGMDWIKERAGSL